ncbi:telomeric repeat-binding factor 1 [Cheilinus undulatus]|uniref:telomeric repeat-binding factor 1 n=1 Tax=Cheilinus undulatus TaxID=241271 RepID=UPI001BD5C8C5|nr:telomeric repeat-binding factor 1 [Cheilinus undulatus]
MELEISSKTALDANKKDVNVNFPQVAAVATSWTLDFMFVSLCRYFKEDKLEEFNETLSGFEAVSQSTFLKEAIVDEKRMICALLARVMHGKQLDVLYEEDNQVMPLMSAAKVWSNLEDSVADKSLFQNISVLLLVQSIAVCLEKGQRSSASSALKWFEENHDIPQSLRLKLTTIVTERETYHPFLMSLSFSRLRETIHSYVDEYLKKNPSDYLLQAATKALLSQKKTEDLEDEGIEETSLTQTADNSTDKSKEEKKAAPLKTKRKLLSTKMTDVWKPDTCKKAVVSLRRLSYHELSQRTSKSPANTSKIQKTRKPPRKWTKQLDKCLRDGVKHHGVGKWARILLDYDFEGRTGTMLKDRWRVLIRTHNTF